MENKEKQIEALKKKIEQQEDYIEELLTIIEDLRNQIAFPPKYRKIARKVINCIEGVRGKFLKFFDPNKKRGMILRLIVNTVKHPINAFNLFVKIKKLNLHYGDFCLDMLYLKNGKIKFEKFDDIDVSIVIPVYNQIEYTYKCLKSIKKYTNNIKYEVIIANDVSNDATRKIESYVDNIVFITNKSNMGFIRNCNNGAKFAKGKYILFLNNDTQVTNNWLTELVNVIDNNSKMGLVGSKLVYPNGELQEAGGIIYNNGTGCNYGKFDSADKPQYNYVREVDYISGASIMIPKKLWEEIGGFDEYYIPAYCEDSDLAFKVRKLGYKTVYVPTSVVVHFEGVSNGVNLKSKSNLKHYQIENTVKLKERWKKEIKDLPSKNLSKYNIKLRDRIDGKKVIVVIDATIPTFDKDAGSKTTYQYLKMFVNQGYIVKFITDNFAYDSKYCDVLQRMGIEVMYGEDYSQNIFKWLEINNENIDYVYLNRPDITEKYIDFIKNNMKAKIFYYGHDLHYLREKREYEITKDEQHLRESEVMKEKEYSVMRKADYVYYPSYIEEEIIKKYDKKINVKAINPYIFENIKEETEEEYSKRDGILFVGGFNHRPNVDAIKWFTEDIYPEIQKHKNIKFYIVGSNTPKEIKKLNSSNIIVKGFVTEEELAEIYKNVRMIVVPLRYGAGIKGKVVEALYKGVSIISTSIGVEGLKDVEKITFVADDEKSFAKQIIDNYDNTHELYKRAEKGKKYIEDNFSEKAAWKVIKNDFK